MRSHYECVRCCEFTNIHPGTCEKCGGTVFRYNADHDDGPEDERRDSGDQEDDGDEC